MSLKINSREFKRADLHEVVGRVDSSTAPQLEQALRNPSKRDIFISSLT